MNVSQYADLFGTMFGVLIAICGRLNTSWGMIPMRFRMTDDSLSLSALHFLSASLNCDLLLFIVLKTAPDRGLPQDRHSKKDSLALVCSSFTQSFSVNVLNFNNFKISK